MGDEILALPIRRKRRTRGVLGNFTEHRPFLVRLDVACLQNDLATRENISGAGAGRWLEGQDYDRCYVNAN